MDEQAVVYLIDDEPCLLRALKRLVQGEGTQSWPSSLQRTSCTTTIRPGQAAW